MDNSSDEEIENLEKLLLIEEDLKKNENEERPVYAPKFMDILNNQKQPIKVPELEKEKPKEKSVVHSGDTDSSDDEDVRNFLEQKYNEYGRNLKQQFKREEEAEKDYKFFSFGKDKKLSLSKNFSKNISTALTSDVVTSAPLPKPTIKTAKPTVPSNPLNNPNVFCDPIFGIKIIHPLVSSTTLVERMEGRTPVSLARVRLHTERGDRTKDWVIAGVITAKSPPKTSQKGDLFSIWTLTDLKGDIKMLSLFLFKNAHKDLWKTNVGMVIGVLNPSILERKDDKVEAVLSISNPSLVMILGQSKDLGTCHSVTKSGQKCTSIVNKSECDVCVYHMKQEYSKTSKRSEFQSGMLGRGLNELRNKVLGKSEVFYAGQSFTAIKATKNMKQVKKDQQRLMTLSEAYQSPFSYDERAGTSGASSGGNSALASLRAQKLLESAQKTKVGLAPSLDVGVSQRKKDLERLRLLQGETADSDPQPSTSWATQTPKISSPLNNFASPKLKPQPTLSSLAVTSLKKPELSFSPRLSSGSLTFELDLTSNKRNEFAKRKALEVLKRKPIEKVDPNFVKHRGTESGKKRALEELNSSATDDNDNVKRAKISEDEEAAKKKERILAIMNAKSSHSDLVEAHEQTEQEKYFKNLERKENLEEKMLKTTEMQCKAVVCLKCKYIAFSAADRCKQENHELRVKDAVKRFYKCLDCNNRTVTLYRIPKTSCKNCQSSRWERTGMMKEKDIKVGEKLSIRGDEEMFIGTATELANINLLVPDDS